MVEAVEGREVMSEQLPELHYFLNNGREDITAEEQTTILTLTGKSMCFERKGQDGASVPEIEYPISEFGPVGNGDGVSLMNFGLGIPLVEAVESQSESRAAESDVSRECERRTHLWSGQDGGGLDYEEEPPLDDSGGWGEEYPDDHGHL